MGEAKKRGLVVRQQVVEALGLQTASGQIKVRWDENGQATAQGQMAFFIEFLSTTGLFDQWVGDCPLNYKSPNGSTLFFLVIRRTPTSTLFPYTSRFLI